MEFLKNVCCGICRQVCCGRIWGRIALAVLIPLLVCVAALVAVSFMPDEPLRAHVVAAEQDGYFDKNYPKYLLFRGVDMYSECVGLGAAVELRPTADSLIHFRHHGSCEGLKASAANDFSGGVQPYTRYLHGYMVLLKPLYSLFDMATARVLLVSVGVSLLAAFGAVLARSNGRGWASAMLLSFCFAGTLNVFLLATHAIQFWIVLMGAMAASLHSGRAAPVVLFTVLGVLDAFTSFLLMGSLSLGLPLLCYCLTRWNDNDPPDRIVAYAVAASIGWSIGLLATWLGKWGVALLYAPGMDLLGTLPEKYTASGAGMVAEAVMNNLEKSLWRVWLPCFLLLGWRLYRERLPFSKGLWVVLLPAVMPLVWVSLLPGQSGIMHSAFVTIIMWPAIAAVFFLLLAMPRRADGVVLADIFRQVFAYLRALAALVVTGLRRLRTGRRTA